MERFRIEVENFGPIAKANFSLKPLTIFIGPNNTGKSYSAMLLYTFLYSRRFRLMFSRRGKIRPYRFMPSGIERFTKDKDFQDWLKKCFDKLIRSEPAILPVSIRKRFYEAFINDLAMGLENEFKRTYASTLNELVRDGLKSFTIKLEMEEFGASIEYKSNKLHVKNFSVSEKISDITMEPISETSKGARPLYFKENKIFIDKRLLEPEIFEPFTYFIYEELEKKFFESIEFQPLYLPAARSGILQGHKALAAAIIRQTPYFGIEEIPAIPTFSGVVSDFISTMIELEKTKGRFRDLANYLEKEVIEGGIELVLEKRYSYPEIYYTDYKVFGTPKISLHKTSSMVSELAPLILYLKHLVTPYSYLIIEEPEAHLHPKVQIKLARTLIKLVRRGVKVLVTTHSDFLLGQINNFILMSYLDKEERKKNGYDEDDFVKPEEVGVYLFKFCEKDGGGITEEIHITKEGISQDSFAGVADELYGETVRLERKLMQLGIE